MLKRDIRKIKWYEEVADFFEIDEELLKATVPNKRLGQGCESSETLQARTMIAEQFMSPAEIELLERIRTDNPEALTDEERSASWREYIFVCINGERRNFKRLHYYDALIQKILSPLLGERQDLTVLDYGCGSSLFTRLIAQEFGDRVNTISADVCRPAVDFSVTRNRLHNPRAAGHLIDNIMWVPDFKAVDLLFADSVFEHLPNSNEQIQGLIRALAPGGILIENYSGHSAETPHKSDTFSAYSNRDRNLDLLAASLSLLHGKIPQARDGRYGLDEGLRIWVNGDPDDAVNQKIRRELTRRDIIRTVVGKVRDKLTR